jgi:hypothetical protein
MVILLIRAGASGSDASFAYEKEAKRRGVRLL